MKSLEDLIQRGFRYALALCHDPDEAEDVLQDAWVAVLSARGPHTAGYLFAAIRTRFIDRYRRRMLVVIESVEDEEALGAAPGPLDAEERVRADLDTVERGLGVLRPEEREVLFLSAVEGYTAQEIADATGRPRGTVLSLIHRGRRRLRQLLESEVRETGS